MNKDILGRVAKHLKYITTAFVLMTSSTYVYAGFLELTVFGEVTSTDQNNQNDFGLSFQNTVSLSAIFDDTAFTGSGFETIDLSSGSGNSLSLFMGNLTFTADNEHGFQIGFPVVHFVDGIFSSLDYVAYIGMNGAPASLFSGDQCCNGFDWSGLDGNRRGVAGMWNEQSSHLQATQTPDIPEPAPLALAIIGLLGAWIASKREKTLT